MPRLIAYWISSAVFLSPSESMILYLWNSTVRGEMSSALATSFAEPPSASSHRMSRWRPDRVTAWSA